MKFSPSSSLWTSILIGYFNLEYPDFDLVSVIVYLSTLFKFSAPIFLPETNTAIPLSPLLPVKTCWDSFPNENPTSSNVSFLESTFFTKSSYSPFLKIFGTLTVTIFPSNETVILTFWSKSFNSASCVIFVVE